MKKSFVFISLTALLLFASSCARINEPTNGQIQLELDNVMKSSIEQYKAPGMILAVWVPGKGKYVKAMGLSDIKTGRKMQVSDRFRIGSNTKSVVATVILQLVDRKKLSLDDKLSRFFPEWPNSNNITIRMLLDHTSGIFNYSTSEKFGELLESDPKRPFTPRQLISYAINEKPYFEPGKGFNYSNTNTVLLGMIIEKLTGHTLASEVKARIFEPLGLKNTYFPVASETNGNMAHGYMFKNGKADDWTYANPSWGWAAGAIISNMPDLKILITAITDGALISRKLQKERMSTWVELAGTARKDFPSARYGYNVFTFGGFVGHNGGLPGYISYMVRDPKTGITTTMMMNTQPEGEASLEILKKVIQIILPGRKV
ncbi:MAG: serine hydrolase domain-containing protein [bacterium]